MLSENFFFQTLDQKLRGAYYTGADIASYMANRVLATIGNQRVLEPSFGDGVFFQAIYELYQKMGQEKSFRKNVFGVEIHQEARELFLAKKLLPPSQLIHSDFLDMNFKPVDVIIGNPPYVSLKRLSTREQQVVQRVLQKNFYSMPLNGSLWAPFLLHSISLLRKQGTVAFVLPFELTYVRYALDLWKRLGKQFQKLSIVRIYEDIFPEVDVETVLFIAEGKGGSTESVNYELYDTKKNLLRNKGLKRVKISISDILSGYRPFVFSLLEDEHIQLLNSLEEANVLAPANEVVKFKIGYVSGDKKYFHPNLEKIKRFNLSENVLLPAIPDAKSLKGGTGLAIEKGSINQRLFYPAQENVSPTTLNYIEYGADILVNKKYKTSSRSPWYFTPNVEVPDLVLTVFGEVPRIYVNSGNYVASNSLLGGFVQGKIKPLDVALSWYNSLTLLSAEANVHSLGGGVLVAIPSEVDKIKIVPPRLLNGTRAAFTKELNSVLRKNNLGDAYQIGDQYILSEIGLSNREVEIIRDGVRILRDWRSTAKRKGQGASSKLY